MRILELWCREHPDATGLPPALPFVVYHADEPWTSPRSPHELVDLSGCDAATAQFLGPLQMQLPYVLLDLSQLDEPALDAMRVSAVTGLVLRFLQFLRSCPLADAGPLLRLWQPLFLRLLEHRRGADVLFALLTWYTARNQADHETLRSVMTKIREEIPPMRSCLDMLLEMGEERGLAKGREQGLRTLLEGLLRTRFGELPPHLQDRIDTADAEALQRWGLRVLTAVNVDEVFADAWVTTGSTRSSPHQLPPTGTLLPAGQQPEALRQAEPAERRRGILDHRLPVRPPGHTRRGAHGIVPAAQAP